MCGRTLARAHARSGDAATISGYRGPILAPALRQAYSVEETWRIGQPLLDDRPAGDAHPYQRGSWGATEAES